jgi:hypothetical protein
MHFEVLSGAGTMDYICSVNIESGYGVDNRDIEFGFSTRAGDLPLLHSFQAGPGAHPVSFSMGTADIFSGDTATGARN